MLNSLRKAAGTWVAKLLLGLLILSFAVWGISGTIFGGAGNYVLEAGDTRVSIVEYRLAYDRQVSVMSQQFGTRLTREQASSLGVDQQVLTQLVAGAVLDEQASDMRLGLSRDQLAVLTAQDPAFHGPDGRFNRQQFEFVLRQVGMRPEDYLRNREQVAVRQQIVQAATDGLRVPDTFLRAASLYQGEDRTVEFITVPRSTVEPVPAPSADQLATYFEDNRQTYAAPEFRRISYVKLEPSDLADEAAITDEQVRDYYDANAARYTEAERRTIDQLVFSSQEDAAAALETIRAGGTFEEAVAATGREMGDVRLGTFTRDRVADPAIAEAAFALDEGGVSDVVRGSFGHVLIRVDAIEPAVVRPFEEVSDEIRTELALEEASRILYEVHDAYEDSRAAGMSMEEAAREHGLSMETVEAVDRNGRDPDGEVISGLPESQALLREAFETEVGIENPPLDIGATGFLFYEVEEITAARERTLDEVRERVAADWTADEAGTRLSTRMTELLQRLRDGTALEEIATELGVEPQTVRGLSRGSENGGLGRAGVAAVFGVPRDGSGVVAAPEDAAQILFHVTEVVEPFSTGPDAVPAETRDALSSGLSDDLLDQLVARLQGRYEVRVNQSAVNQALSF